MSPPPGTTPKISKDRILIHGVFTHDYFAMIRVLHDARLEHLESPYDLDGVPFALAIIVYGDTQTERLDEPRVGILPFLGRAQLFKVKDGGQ